MKKLILSLLVLCSGAAMAQATPVQVTQECIRQMSLGICMAIPSRANLIPGETKLFSGVGRLSAYAYQDYMDLYNVNVPSDPAMCSLALEKMNVDPAGDHAKIARALWTPSDDVQKHPDPSTIADEAIARAMTSPWPIKESLLYFSAFAIFAALLAAVFLELRKPQKRQVLK